MSLRTKSAVLSFSGSGDNTIISAGNVIHVWGLVFTVAGATNITFKSGSTPLSGAIIFTANGSNMALPIGNEPWYTAVFGSAFIINSSQAVQLSGTIWYTQ